MFPKDTSWRITFSGIFFQGMLPGKPARDGENLKVSTTAHFSAMLTLSFYSREGPSDRKHAGLGR